MKTSGIKWFIIAALLVIAVQIVFGFIVGNFFSSWADAGVFGDMFGAINTLFAGLAFAGIIFAIFLQSKELELQREELKQTRAELKGQKEQLKNQNETLQLQNFENTFFQMLRLHNDIVKDIDVKIQTGSVDDNTMLGRDCFKRFCGNYWEIYNGISPMDPPFDPDPKCESPPPLERIDMAYNQFLKDHQADTGHYFRNLYNIIKFVKNSKINNKKMYTNLVRAQLSEYELALLFYNCLSHVGEKFKPMAEEFSLLKNMFLGDLIDPAHKDLYNPSAFASSSETITSA